MKIPVLKSRRQGDVPKFLPLREIKTIIKPSQGNLISEFARTSFSRVYFRFNIVPALFLKKNKKEKIPGQLIHGKHGAETVVTLCYSMGLLLQHNLALLTDKVGMDLGFGSNLQPNRG